MSIYKKYDNKRAMRSELDLQMAMFLSNSSNKITKCPTHKVTPKKKKDINVVEIEVDFLPKALQDKFFKGL